MIESLLSVREIFHPQHIAELGRMTAYFAFFGIIFAESGLFFGFFLPGDSLLFTAGFLASQDILNIWVLVPVFFVAAVLGDSVGYSFGRRVGRRIFNRDDSFFFHKKHIDRAEKFYEKHGKKTIIIARFVPVVRTFAPIVAGIGKMDYSTFLAYNVIGGVLWAVGLTIAGYILGAVIPNLDKYLHIVVGIIIIVSLLPAVWHVAKDPEMREGIISKLPFGKK